MLSPALMALRFQNPLLFCSRWALLWQPAAPGGYNWRNRIGPASTSLLVQQLWEHFVISRESRYENAPLLRSSHSGLSMDFICPAVDRSRAGRGADLHRLAGQ